MSPEGPFLSSCLGLHGTPCPLVTIHSENPKLVIEHLRAGGRAVHQAGQVPAELTAWLEETLSKP